MNGVHDMGGMHGFGPVDTMDDSPFHHDWEVRFHALLRVLGVHGLYTVDERRKLRERLHPTVLLQAGYYERRLLPVERLLIARDVLAENEVSDRMEAGVDSIPERNDPELVERTRAVLAADSTYEMEPQPPQFETGDNIVVQNNHLDGHTRCPRYVRRVRGIVDAYHGTQRFPDAASEGLDVGEPLYSIRFAASDVWGDDHSDSDCLVLQLWEPYLEAV